MENYFKYVQEKSQYYPPGPRFTFPTKPEHPPEHDIDTVINKVKDVVSQVASSITTMNPTTEMTMPETITPEINIAENTTSSIMDIIQITNNTIFEESINSNSTMTGILENANNTIINVSETVNDTMVQDIFTTTEEIATTTMEKVNESTPSLMDWLSNKGNDYVNHNLTMIHDTPKTDHDQTLFIILGVMLGVLVAISLILLLIYISYKRRNLYTLQEQASSVNRVVSMHCTSTDKDQTFEPALEDNRSGYKF